MAIATASTETPAPAPVPATVHTLPCAPDPGLERVARGLRSARARTGLSEQQTVALVNERGAAISLMVLVRAERTGVIDFSLAVHLADVYGMTTDCLAGRRAGQRQVASPGLSRL
jgi:hypothetical protein